MIIDNSVCESCEYKYTCEEEVECEAMKKLYKFAKKLSNQNKREVLKELKKEIDYFETEIDEEAEKIATRLLEKFSDEFDVILSYDIKIGYVKSMESKKKGDKLVYGDCKKVNDVYSAFLPFDFIITTYERNTGLLDKNQLAIVIYHELKHVGIGPKGLRIEEHDFEEFFEVANKFGVSWDIDSDLPNIWEV